MQAASDNLGELPPGFQYPQRHHSQTVPAVIEPAGPMQEHHVAPPQLEQGDSSVYNTSIDIYIYTFMHILL